MWILLLATAARAAVFVLAEVRPALFDFPDSHRYAAVAVNIAEGAGPIDHEQLRSGTDPIYPYILSLAPRFGAGETISIFRWGRVVNALVSLASVLILAALVRRLIGTRAALIAALILAVDPILLFFNALVLTESLYVLLLLSAFLFLSLTFEPGSGRSPANALPSVTTPNPTSKSRTPSPFSWALCAGLCLGLGTLTRSTSLFFPLLLAPAFILVARQMKTPKPAALALAMIFAAGFTLTPTLIRNYRLYGHIIPARIGGGASLLEALGPWADGAPGMDRILYPATPAGANEFERDAIYRQAALDWAKENPAKTLDLAFAKLARTWSIEMNASGYTSPIYRIVCWLTVAPEFALALIGLWLLRTRRALLAFLLAPALYFTLIHMIFVGSVRYRLPAMPFLFALAATAVAAWCCRGRPDRTT